MPLRSTWQKQRFHPEAVRAPAMTSQGKYQSSCTAVMISQGQGYMTEMAEQSDMSALLPAVECLN